MNRLVWIRRILCLCLLSFLLLSLPACGGKSDEPETPPEVDTEQTLKPEPEPEPAPEPEPEPPIPFTDVPEDASYYDTVVWAYESGILSDGSAFEPDSACTRAQVITFLWRSAGSPEPQITENPFSDVSSSDWYYKPVLWAYENAVVTGTVFNSGNSCTNAETLTFLWRAEGKPMAAVYSSPIALSDSDAYYARPVAWAENNGMFAGMDSAFDPTAPCRRADIVTYLRWTTEQWTFTGEDRTIQAEYEQIINDAQLYEVHGSGLIYADYVDVEGDGKVELLTLSGSFGGEFTATIYANIEGHVEKSCEETFEPLGGRMADFSLCKADAQLYLYMYCEMAYGYTHSAIYQFYKVEKGAVTLANDLERSAEYVEKEDDFKSICTDFGKEITEDEYDTILGKYTDKKELFCIIEGGGVDVINRGILPDRATYMKDVYAAVLNGDFSFFAGTYASEYGDDAIFDADGTLTTSRWETKPVSITVSEDGVICCLGPYKSVSELSLSGDEFQERYEIRPAGVGSIQNTQIWYSRFGDGGVDYYKVS